MRELLGRLGLRYGRGRRKLPGSPDIVNFAKQWAIFVHGCFWHSHRGCQRATVPKRNRTFWLAKFAANRKRDRRVLNGVEKLGFTSIVVWECEAEEKPDLVLRRLAAELPGAKRSLTTSHS